MDAIDSVALDVATLTALLLTVKLCALIVATLVAVTLVTLFVFLEGCGSATVVELELMDVTIGVDTLTLDVAMVTEKIIK